jgi:hypothetical protein
MPTNATRRYQATYRQDEIDLIIRLALRGESLALVGPAGMGKSNIVNFLREINQHAPHLEQDMAQLHFPIVDATYWEETPLSLWKIMLDALNQATQELAAPQEEQKIIPISEEERVLNTLRARLQWVCQELNQRVMFVLDDFDTVLETGPLAMLERLNGLRSEGNREAMSFLMFTKRLPHVLGRSYDLEHDSKFYDLFRAHIYALEPCTAEDAYHMLQHLNEVAGNPLSERELAAIRQLVGGHARLLKIVFDLWSGEGMAGVNPLTHLVEQPDVQQECRRILHSLHEDEQAVLVRAALNALTPADQELANHLARRGLLMADTQKLFSPLLSQFLVQFGERE